MLSPGTFLHVSTREQSVLVSTCQRCGKFIAASPTGKNLKIAEAAHQCDSPRSERLVRYSVR